MLKPISQPFCCSALNECLKLQLHLLHWLCDPAVKAADVTQGNLAPPRVPTQIEADWLWQFLWGRKQTRLRKAQIIAEMSDAQKSALLDWCIQVVDVVAQFQPAPSAWPVTLPVIPLKDWVAFKDLMEAFYERGLKSGLPYQSNGTPVATGGVNYKQFLKAFRDAHRLTPDPDAREVCVLCGGPLGQSPEVDHWILKSDFPLLSVCADNLLPICGECNSTANKGVKGVHSNGSFADWYHPYFRPANGSLYLKYDLPKMEVKCTAIKAADKPKADNLDRLLNLSDRWTRAFKAEYHNQLEKLRRKRSRGQGPNSIAELQIHLQSFCDDLVPSEPHNEVHQVLAEALLDPARTASWQAELGIS